MDHKALAKILSDLSEKSTHPDLETGKLYWIIPDNVERIEDIPKNTYQGYKISKFKPIQKHSYYLHIVRRDVEYHDVYPFEQPVMVLGNNLKSSEERKYIDMLVGDKRYDKVVFEPIKMDWKLIPCKN